MSLSVVTVATLLVSAVCLSSASGLEEAIRQQLQELKNIRCEPKTVVANISDYLSVHDPLRDELYYPQMVAVNRCSLLQSFCGDSYFGVPTGECRPNPQDVVAVSVAVYYYNDGEKKMAEVQVPEHKACMCSEL